MNARTLRGISEHPPPQPGLFGDVVLPPGPPPKHLRAALEDLMNGWGLVVGTRHNATDHYGESVAAMLEAAREALDEGVTPYQVLLLTVAPAFRHADELPLEVIKVDA